MIDSVIFDMDGVLVDSERHWKDAEDHFLDRVMKDRDSFDTSRFTGMCINGVYALLKENGLLKVSREELITVYEQMADFVYLEKTELMPGVEKILEELAAQEIRIAVASSSKIRWVRMALDKFSISRFFSVVVSSDDVGGTGKPSPLVYQETLHRLEIKSADALAIEDSEHGVAAAKACGIFCIGFRNGCNRTLDLSLADVIVSGFEQMNFQALFNFKHDRDSDRNLIISGK